MGGIGLPGEDELQFNFDEDGDDADEKWVLVDKLALHQYPARKDRLDGTDYPGDVSAKKELAPAQPSTNNPASATPAAYTPQQTQTLDPNIHASNTENTNILDLFCVYALEYYYLSKTREDMTQTWLLLTRSWPFVTTTLTTYLTGGVDIFNKLTSRVYQTMENFTLMDHVDLPNALLYLLVDCKIEDSFLPDGINMLLGILGVPSMVLSQLSSEQGEVINQGKVINNGNDGYVVQLVESNSKVERCVKCPYEWTDLANEQAILQHLKHKYPYKYAGISLVLGSIIMPLGTDLNTELKRNPNDMERVHWASSILYELNDLHNACVIHGDIKPGNAIIYNNELRFIDFMRSIHKQGGSDNTISRKEGLGSCTHAYSIFYWQEHRQTCTLLELDMFAVLLTLYHPDTNLQSILSQQEMSTLIQKINQEAYHEFTAPYSIHEITNCYTRLIGIENLLTLMQTALSSEPDPSVRNYFSDEGRSDVIQTTKKLEREYPAFKQFRVDEKTKVAKQILSMRQQTNTSCTSRMFSCWFEAPSDIKRRKLDAIKNSLSNLETPCSGLQLDDYKDSIDYKIIGLFRKTKTRQVINIIAGHQIMEKNSNHTTSTIQ